MPSLITTLGPKPADELGMGRHLVSVDPILKMVQERRTKGERGEDRP